MVYIYGTQFVENDKPGLSTVKDLPVSYITLLHKTTDGMTESKRVKQILFPRDLSLYEFESLSNDDATNCIRKYINKAHSDDGQLTLRLYISSDEPLEDAGRVMDAMSKQLSYKAISSTYPYTTRYKCDNIRSAMQINGDVIFHISENQNNDFNFMNLNRRS